MAKYNIHAGHCPDGKGASGAVGFLKESTEARKVKNEVIKQLKALGHTVYDCTCDSNATQSGCLSAIVKKCNQHTVSIDVSIHLNSGRNDKKGDNKTGGVEVLVRSSTSKAKDEATKICKEIAKELGVTNRGVKTTTGLYVLNHTKAPALLVECCFVDDKDDYKKWNTNKCATGIVKGLTGKTATTTKTEPAIQETKTWLEKLQKAIGTTVDNDAGPKTLEACPTLKTGSSGTATRLLKDKLKCGNSSKVFGSGTKKAVKAYQKKHGLKVDGIVGKNTWKKLLGL